MSQFAGKVALVTGAASGIGLSVARRMSAEGARVAVVDLDESGGKSAADEVDGLFVAADVSDPEQIAAAVRSARAELGRLDIAHLNAGVVERDVDLVELDVQGFQRAWGINVGGVVFGAKACVQSMSEGGQIIATASLAGLMPYPTDPVYGLTKHAVVGFVRSVAQQLAPRNIRINAICPGFVETPMLQGAVPLFRRNDFPLLQPEDVATAVVQIATSNGTGQIFVCQPGRTCELYEFRGVPGPRVEGAAGIAPPSLGDGRAHHQSDLNFDT
ncbi:MAG TPA: SDR family oxidoreductase [Actinomycetota bacterium]|nr:SDR family oxidoreductase [Actinomycetota bacterium]